VGGESSAASYLVSVDPKLATIFDQTDVLVLIFSYFFGILPFIHFEREAALLPYMTRDYIKMKFEERKQAKGLGGKFYYTFYIYMMQICNIVWNPVLDHLNKRGIFTCYWVIN
jgi:hypothetical protein